MGHHHVVRGGFRHHLGFRKTEVVGVGGGLIPFWSPLDLAVARSGWGITEKWRTSYFLSGLPFFAYCPLFFVVFIDPDSCCVPDPVPHLFMRAGSGSKEESQFIIIICQWFLSLKQWSRKVNIGNFAEKWRVSRPFSVNLLSKSKTNEKTFIYWHIEIAQYIWVKKCFYSNKLFFCWYPAKSSSWKRRPKHLFSK